MPYGSPVETASREYKIMLSSVDQVAGYPVTITCSASTDNMNHADVATVFQQFVDFLGDGGPDFSVLSGYRVIHYTEAVTATT